MADLNKIKEIFHYYNLQSEVDSVYGNWAVSVDGDVVNYLYPYAFLSIHFSDEDRVAKLKNKVWFKPECESELNKALNRAREINNNKH